MSNDLFRLLAAALRGAAYTARNQNSPAKEPQKSNPALLGLILVGLGFVLAPVGIGIPMIVIGAIMFFGSAFK